MTFDAQMRIGSVEIAAALFAVAVAAARPRALPQKTGRIAPVRVALRIVSLHDERTHEGLCPLVIGRATEADIVVSDPEASRRHARFECENGIVYVRDLESRNGTFLNGRRIRDAIEVRKGDEIDVGTTRLVVEDMKSWT